MTDTVTPTTTFHPEDITSEFVSPSDSLRSDVNASTYEWTRNHSDPTELVDKQTETVPIIILCSIASLAILLNSIVLVASKFATGGKTSTLVYIRSFCAADILTGVFGVVKTLLVLLNPRWVNCFLGESLLFSSICSSSLTLVLVSIDLHFQLTHSHELFKCMDKKWAVFVLVLLWNISFALGFMPQMGWVNEDFVCEFFRFHSSHYLILIACLLFSCIIAILAIHIKIYWMMYSITSHNRLRSGTEHGFAAVSSLVLITRYNLAAIIIFYLPFVFFTLLKCEICPHFSYNESQTALHILMCWLLLKAIFMAPLYGAKTSQIFRIFSRYCHCCNESPALQNNSDSTTNSSQAELIASSTIPRPHPPARNTNSSNSSLVSTFPFGAECRRCGHVNPAFYDSTANLSPNATAWFTKSSGAGLKPKIIIERPADSRQIDLGL